MANPGHALAASNLAEIQMLRTELNQLKVQHQMAMTHLSNGVKELTDLLVKKGVASHDEIMALGSLTTFMNMQHGNIW